MPEILRSFALVYKNPLLKQHFLQHTNSWPLWCQVVNWTIIFTSMSLESHDYRDSVSFPFFVYLPIRVLRCMCEVLWILLPRISYCRNVVSIVFSVTSKRREGRRVGYSGETLLVLVSSPSAMRFSSISSIQLLVMKCLLKMVTKTLELDQ